MNYGLIGNNISYSLSPSIYDYWFKKYNIKASYNLIDIKIESFNKEFLLNLAKNSAYGGFNITKPFKEKAYYFFNNINDELLNIKSINTIAIKNNNIEVYNTDYLGLKDSFEYYNISLTNKNILILGAGGSARSLIYFLLPYVNKIFIKNRTKEKITEIIKDFKSSKIQEFQEEELENIDTIFNATSVNFAELLNVYKTKNFNKNLVLYDLNYYNKILPTAKNMLYNGIMMLLFQARHNFFIWFGIYPEVDDNLIHMMKQK